MFKYAIVLLTLATAACGPSRGPSLGTLLDRQYAAEDAMAREGVDVESCRDRWLHGSSMYHQCLNNELGKSWNRKTHTSR